MKTLLVFILWAAVGLVVGWKLGYEFVINKVTNEVTSIVTTVSEQGAGTGTNTLVDTYGTQAQQMLEAQKEKIRIQIKQKLTEYFTNKIDETF